MQRTKILTHRYESFGGILHLGRPAALVWVDKDYMRSLGYPDSPLWDSTPSLLSAPTEAHVAVTRQCSAGCSGCYMDSYLPGTRPDLQAKELGLEGMKQVVDALAEIRVFHLALGGGESLELPWFLELAEYVRDRGMIPNLTTNGFPLDENNAKRCRVFGQINVSLDGVGDAYRDTRGVRGFEAADRALSLLRKARCRTGINVVVSRRNVHDLETIFRYARRMKLNQVELLRFKPSGRGLDPFPEMDLTPEQALAFYPRVIVLARRFRIRLRLDCSFMPMVFAHRPDPGRIDLFAIAGCHGGEMLLGVDPAGQAGACSFAEHEPLAASRIRSWWEAPETFRIFRSWHENAHEPCASCAYLAACRGGCHVVARAVLGDPRKPDPGCPRVQRETNPSGH
jgi:radical SAM protein with 4Fe4S-binding SPASM domain